MIELPEFFNNPSIIEIGNFRIQYYALTWILSAILIFQHLKRSKILAAHELLRSYFVLNAERLISLKESMLMHSTEF